MWYALQNIKSVTHVWLQRLLSQHLDGLAPQAAVIIPDVQAWTYRALHWRALPVGCACASPARSCASGRCSQAGCPLLALLALRLLLVPHALAHAPPEAELTDQPAVANGQQKQNFRGKDGLAGLSSDRKQATKSRQNCGQDGLYMLNIKFSHAHMM